MSEASSEKMTPENTSYNTNYDTAPRKIINTVSNQPVNLRPIDSLEKKKKPWGIVAAAGSLILLASAILAGSQSNADGNKDKNIPPTHSSPIPSPEINSQITKK